MSAKVIIELTFAMLAAQGFLTLNQAERLVRDVSMHFEATPLEDISMREVYDYLKPICDLWAAEDAA